MAAVLFWLAGAGGLLVFSLMTVIYGIFVHADLVLSVLAVPIGFGVVWYFGVKSGPEMLEKRSSWLAVFDR